MKRLIKSGAIAIAILGASGEAFAQLPDVFAQQVFTNGQPSGVRVGVKGTPRTQVAVTLTPANGFSGQERTRPARVNACGFAVVPNANTLGNTIGFAAQSGVDIGSILNVSNPAIGVPDCINGSPSFPLPNNPGQFVYKAPNNSILIIGLDPSRVINIRYSDSSPISRFVSINECGFGLVSPPSGFFNIAVGSGSPVNWGSLPISEYRCVSGETFQKASPSQISAIPESFRSGSDIWYKAAPFTQISTSFEGQPNVRSATSDRCGGLLLGSTNNPVSGEVKINGVSVGDVSSFPVADRPACRLSGGTYSF
ncbi:MAG: hypothetical protein IM535_00750, partial [Pseudanabaena sp. M38BS1SP1A06MG]|nr:hypothetical protein [Pseudanabaena sp. M38BS1SP1A06MG]